MKEYRIIVETIFGLTIKADNRREAEKLALEELSTDSNIVSKQVLSVCRLKQNPKHNAAE